MNAKRQNLKSWCKSLLNAGFLVVTWPCAALCRVQERLYPHREEMFAFWGQVLSLAPGLLGVYLRRGFYRQTLDYCSADCFIGFGTIFSHRQARVESTVYIGNYALIGSVILRRGCLIGSRASLLSGGNLHTLDDHGHWTPTDHERRHQVDIGEHAWLGEAVTVLANVGAGAMVSAGSVVASPVPERVMVAGNPARFVKRLESPLPDANPDASVPNPQVSRSANSSLAEA